MKKQKLQLQETSASGSGAPQLKITDSPPRVKKSFRERDHDDDKVLSVRTMLTADLVLLVWCCGSLVGRPQLAQPQ